MSSSATGARYGSLAVTSASARRSQMPAVIARLERSTPSRRPRSTDTARPMPLVIITASAKARGVVGGEPEPGDGRDDGGRRGSAATSAGRPASRGPTSTAAPMRHRHAGRGDGQVGGAGEGADGDGHGERGAEGDARVAEPQGVGDRQRGDGERRRRAISAGGQLGGAGEHGDAADPGERAEREVAGDPAPVEDDADGGGQHGAADQPGDDRVGLGDEARHGDAAGDERQRRQDPGPLLGDVGAARSSRPARRDRRTAASASIRLPTTPTATSVTVRLEGHDRCPRWRRARRRSEPARCPLSTRDAGDRHEGDRPARCRRRSPRRRPTPRRWPRRAAPSTQPPWPRRRSAASQPAPSTRVASGGLAARCRRSRPRRGSGRRRRACRRRRTTRRSWATMRGRDAPELVVAGGVGHQLHEQEHRARAR